jgi:hypothetical protein
MGHPEVENQTPFAFEALFIADEDGRPVLTPIIKATYSIGLDGTLELADDQLRVNFAGEHFGEPGESSPKYEPETAFTKLSTDVVLIGHARAPYPDSTEVYVALEVGPLSKIVRVTGDRHWEKGLLGPRMSEPQPFAKIPLVWERAYGGWDTSHDNPEKHGWEPRNPIGVGFRTRRSKLEEGAPLPNLEDPGASLTKYRGRSQPTGFGFLSPNWEPRASLAGTYDEAWEKTRMPLLATDFQRRYFNAAPEDLIAPSYLRGDESVSVSHATREGRLTFALPGLVPPECLVTRRDAQDEVLTTNLDTVIIDADEMQLILLWRSFTTLREGPLDVRSMRITCDNAPEVRAREEPEDNVVPLFSEVSEAVPAPAQGA